MPTHALLGATGATGSAVLQFLLEVPQKDLTLNIFIRNKSKLLKAFPDLETSTALKVIITEANIEDTTALKTCLDKAEVIYNCISSNESAPNISVSRDIAKAIITALKTLRTEQRSSYQPPTVIINRSSTLNPELRKSASSLVAFVHFALADAYYDIGQGCNMFEAAHKDGHLLDYIFADAPSLHESPATGRSGHRLILDGPQSIALSYADLGAGFVDMALHKEQYLGKGVGVSATGVVDQNWPLRLVFIGRGLRARFFRF